ncbi:MAG: hypothetical protein OEZ31_04695 [Nitrospirota bacterium]|nr:hypothetical protein [Nitrospirota bacterium]MDH5768241.1 hypothetical protein [Nitrospirota bacterium]
MEGCFNSLHFGGNETICQSVYHRTGGGTSGATSQLRFIYARLLQCSAGSPEDTIRSAKEELEKMGKGASQAIGNS